MQLNLTTVINAYFSPVVHYLARVSTLLTNDLASSRANECRARLSKHFRRLLLPLCHELSLRCWPVAEDVRVAKIALIGGAAHTSGKEAYTVGISSSIWNSHIQ
jgi:hypothetical protein